MVQWFRICLSNAGEASSIPGWGTKSPRALGQLNHRAMIAKLCATGSHATSEDPMQPNK